MPYKIGPYKYCEYVDDDKYFFEDFRQHSDYPPKGTCPWPKKKYMIRDYVVRISKNIF